MHLFEQCKINRAPRPNLRLENPDACQTDALLCLSDAVWYDSIAEKVKEINTKVKKIEIVVNPSDVNNVIGHKKANITIIIKIIGIRIIFSPIVKEVI